MARGFKLDNQTAHILNTAWFVFWAVAYIFPDEIVGPNGYYPFFSEGFDLTDRFLTCGFMLQAIFLYLYGSQKWSLKVMNTLMMYFQLAWLIVCVAFVALTDIDNGRETTWYINIAKLAFLAAVNASVTNASSILKGSRTRGRSMMRRMMRRKA